MGIKNATMVTTYNDFVKDIFNGELKTKVRLASANSSWFSTLHTIFTLVPKETITKGQWLQALLEAFTVNSIECFPGHTRGRVSITKVARLTGQDRYPINSPKQSLESAVSALQSLGPKPIKTCIKFDNCFPFSSIPSSLQQGAKYHIMEHSKRQGNMLIVGHYKYALALMGEKLLLDPVMQTLFLIVLTLSSSTVLPNLPSAMDPKWCDCPKQKNMDSWGFVLAVRMMWYLYPNEFQTKCNGGVMGTKELAKKLG